MASPFIYVGPALLAALLAVLLLRVRQPIRLAGITGKKATVQGNAWVTACNAEYLPAPSWELINGKALFMSSRGDRFLYFTHGHWVITYDRSHMARNKGIVQSASINNASPLSVHAWQVYDDASDSWVTVPSATSTALSAMEATVAATRLNTALAQARRPFALTGIHGERAEPEINALIATSNADYVPVPDEELVNGRTLFLASHGNGFIYFSTWGRWMVTSSRTKIPADMGMVRSASLGDQSPLAVRTWEVYGDETSSWIRIVPAATSSALTAAGAKAATKDLVLALAEALRPFRLMGIVGQKRRAQHNRWISSCNADYVPALDQELVNGKAKFLSSSGSRRMYLSDSGKWVIASEPNEVPLNKGMVRSASTGDVSPLAVNTWEVYDDAAKAWTSISSSATTTICDSDAATATKSLVSVLAQAQQPFSLTGIVGKKMTELQNTRIEACNTYYMPSPEGSRVNNKTLFQSPHGDRFMFYTSSMQGSWVVASNRVDIANNNGMLRSASIGDVSPIAVDTWEVYDDIAKAWVTCASCKVTPDGSDSQWV